MKPIKDILRSYAQFDEKGRHVNGCDKQSNHNYGDAYERIFTPYIDYHPTRNTVKLMMEVGVADGSCLLAWTEIFPNATIVGMDIHPCSRAKESDRIEFHLGSQNSYEDCKRVAAGRQFDLIIEDATHELTGNLLTLFYLWRYVKPGGLYIIEEFNNIGQYQENVCSLFPGVEIAHTYGPSGGWEPLVVFRKPLL